MSEPHVKKLVEGTTVYYTLGWSEIRKAEKYDIIRTVPSVSGLFELYYQDEKKKLNLIYVAKAYYGGLQNELRKRTDPELEENPHRKKILEKYDCYYRYVPSHSYKDLSDILYFFSATYFPDRPPHEHSGRYAEIYVKEVVKGKLVDI
ncbi:MAG TPA: hypothetical protein ENN69_01185 [Spirochaetia bacterium]|nr:hypothetical protein [Spirochaetia bacterium]